MRRLVIGVLVAMAMAAVAAAGRETCFKRSEERSGGNKICWYRCPSGMAAITVKGYELCPLSIDR